MDPLATSTVETKLFSHGCQQKVPSKKAKKKSGARRISPRRKMENEIEIKFHLHFPGKRNPKLRPRRRKELVSQQFWVDWEKEVNFLDFVMLFFGLNSSQL